MHTATLSAQHVVGFPGSFDLDSVAWPDLDLRIKAPEPGDRHLFFLELSQATWMGLACLRVEWSLLLNQDCFVVSKLECGLLIWG